MNATYERRMFVGQQRARISTLADASNSSRCIISSESTSLTRRSPHATLGLGLLTESFNGAHHDPLRQRPRSAPRGILVGSDPGTLLAPNLTSPLNLAIANVQSKTCCSGRT